MSQVPSWKLINPETHEKAELIHQRGKYWFTKRGIDEEIGSSQRTVRRFLKRRGYELKNKREVQDIAVRHI